MGPHNACSYADLAMTTIDHKILDTNNRPNDIIFPPDWSRFRDDCFSPWFGGIPALLEFTEWLNSLSDSIKFTVKYSEVQLEVLDTLLLLLMVALNPEFILSLQTATCTYYHSLHTIHLYIGISPLGLLYY